MALQGWPLPSEIWRPQNIKISAISQLDREYLWNATGHRQSINGVANYGHSCIGELNSVYFGPQKAKNRTGVLTHPTGGHQAGHCHASSLFPGHFPAHAFSSNFSVDILMLKTVPAK